MDFAPDGSTLYIVGEAKRLDAQGQLRYSGPGLRAVDPASDQVLAEALPGQRLEHVAAAPDGNSVDVVGPGTLDGQPSRHILRRLERSSLEVAAQQVLNGSGKLFFLSPLPEQSRPAGRRCRRG